MDKKGLIDRIANLRGFADYERDTRITAEEVVDRAERQVAEQAPASWMRGYPAAFIDRIARIMVQRREPAERAYLQAR